MLAEFSQLGVALTSDAFNRFYGLTSKKDQEQLSFFYWRPSSGKTRLTAIIEQDIPFPCLGETVETGNVSYKAEYQQRVLTELPQGCGIGLIHNHFGPGWQWMSKADVYAEQKQLAPVVFAMTGFPLLGMTIGTDGTISARFWEMQAAGKYSKHEVDSIRVVGAAYRFFHNPKKVWKRLKNISNRVATLSVWGSEKQELIENLKIGIVGLGSVGSLVVESLARIGVSRFVLVDHDKIEIRNLDRTIGATRNDVQKCRNKCEIAERNIRKIATSRPVKICQLKSKLEENESIKALLDCDFIFSCVDRHYPRYILNFFAYSHLIPILDGGVKVDLSEDGRKPPEIFWRMHLAAPGRACLACLRAFEYGRVQLERSGQLENPVYIEGIPEIKREYARQNVFAFSMSCAAHEVLQFLGYATGHQLISPVIPQIYHALGGCMVEYGGESPKVCNPDGCTIDGYVAKAHPIQEIIG